jgi:hypothetical protein
MIPSLNEGCDANNIGIMMKYMGQMGHGINVEQGHGGNTLLHNLCVKRDANVYHDGQQRGKLGKRIRDADEALQTNEKSLDAFF